MRFKVIVPSFNCRDFIVRCLDSIAAQTYPHMDVLVVDDASTDGTAELSARHCDMLGWDWHRNDQNLKCPRVLWEHIPHLAPEDDDPILIVDGDDFLLHPGVVNFLADEFRDAELWMTYGQFEQHPLGTIPDIAYAAPYPSRVIRARAFRDRKAAPYNQFNHPLVFRYHLWKAAVEEADLKRANGEWFTGGYDGCIMLPMLEAASGKNACHFKCLQQLLYGYNVVNPLNEVRVHSWRAAQTLELYDREPKPQHHWP